MTRNSKFPAKIALSFCTLFCLWPCVAFSDDVDTAWVRRYNGPGNGDDQAVAIAVDTSGNVYVTGSSFDSAGYTDFCTIKYLSNGDTAWVRRYDGPASQDDYAVAIALGADGSIYVLGTVTDTITNPAGRSNSALIKYSPDGEILWSSIPGSSSPARAAALTVDKRGNVYIADTRYYYEKYNQYIYFISAIPEVIKYSATGDFLWAGGWGYCPYSSAKAVAVDGHGNVFLSGTENTAGFCEYGVEDLNYVTIKFDSAGNYLWTKYYFGGTYDIARAIAVDSVGNAFVTGNSGVDFATIRYDTAGNENWVKRFGSSLSSSDGDGGYAIALDKNDNVYVAGRFTEYEPGFYSWLTFKYDSSGNQLWSKYSNLGTRRTIPVMGLDSNGNVHISGGSDFGYLTFKYQADGTELWAKSYSGSGTGTDQAKSIAVDNHGNVYVTGQSLGNGTGLDFATIKYSPLPQLKGDLNLDGILDLNDVVFALNCTFLGEPPQAAPAACDINCDGKISAADVVVLLRMVFAAEPAPC